MTTPVWQCPGCGSKGFERSILGHDRCTFCDGTEGGNPPSPSDVRVSLDLSRNEIFWLASAHMFAVMVLDGRPPSAVSEAYKILVQNAKDLDTAGVNELYTRLSMIVQAKWPDSTTFTFPDENDNQPVAQRNSEVPKNVS